MISAASFTRRHLLGLASSLAGTALLLACGASSSSSTPAAAPTAGSAPAASPQPSSSAPAQPAQSGQELVPTIAAEKLIVTAVPSPVGNMEGNLSLWHSFGKIQGGGLAMLDLIAAFTKLYPKVKITNVYDATPDKYMAAIASGNVPDLLKLSATDIPALGQRGALLALDSYISRDKWDMKQYFDFVVEQCSWGGKTYAITHHPDIRCTFTNPAILKEAGLDPDKVPESWDDLIVWGAKMNKQDNGRWVRFGYVPSWTEANWPTELMQANGATFLSDDGRKVNFNSDQAAEALQWAIDTTDKIDGGYNNTVTMVKSNQYPGAGPPQWLFAQSHLGMMLFGNWAWNAITIYDPKLAAKNAMFPGGPSAKGQGFVFGGGQMVSIPKGAKSPDLAWEWLKFLGSAEGGYLVQARTSDVSGNIQAANDPRIVEAKLGRKEILPYFSKANRFAYLRSPISQQFDDEISRLADRVSLKQMTVKQALGVSEKAIQKALDDYWSTQKS